MVKTEKKAFHPLLIFVSVTKIRAFKVYNRNPEKIRETKIEHFMPLNKNCNVTIRTFTLLI